MIFRSLLALCLLASAAPSLGLAQSRVAIPAEPAGLPGAMPARESGDPLTEALTCRSAAGDLPGLLARLRRERPADFRQTDRQYSAPAMDLYRLQEAVQAWGHASDAIVITDTRVLMVVPGPMETAAQRLEESLAATAEDPLPGALDDQHALVLYEEQRPGLQQQVLIGCEYKLAGLSMLDDPADAWRAPPPAPVAAGIPATAASARP